MASKHLSTFPVLSETMAENVGFEFLSPSFSYENDGEECELIDNNQDSFFHSLIDNRGIWTPEGNYNLIITGSLQIKNRTQLFGENGIAPVDSTVGIALKLSSNQSRRCKSYPFAEFTIDTEDDIFSFKKSFPPGLLRGQISFSIELYIKRSGIPNSKEYHLANTVGSVIGSSTPYIVKLDGNNAGINIVEVNKPGESLWLTDFKCDDPIVELMDAKALTIELNRAHPDYKYIDKKDKNHFFAPLYREVIASAMTLFINSLRTAPGYEGNLVLDIYENKLEELPTQGSIAEQVVKFKEELDLDLETHSSTAISVRKLIDNGLAEI